MDQSAATPAAPHHYHSSMDLYHAAATPLQSRRLRPPSLLEDRDENRVPLRLATDKMRRRDSKLLSIFSRQKSTIDLSATASPSPRDPPPPTPPPRSASIRASLVEISNWPHSIHSSRSDSFDSAHRPYAASGNNPSPPVAPRQTRPPPRTGRGSLATWDPPPLFQAYPQAVRHVELPACTMSAEAIIRMQGARGVDTSEPTENPLETTTSRRKHRRNNSNSFVKSDWTTKIFILVTSGYLLQYAGEGSFDRLPEKILPLSKDSAAFASDVIPGRHWVVQVSAAMDADGTSTADSRSLLSRLPFRGSERRQASVFLMVFESAEEMDQWIAVLRREIEHLGGKKNLSETGKPKADENVLELRAQPSQRTLVVRDPERFSRSQYLDQEHWNPDESKNAAPGILLESVERNTTPDQSFDDVSTTNSFSSHDGRQLDSLREGSNRLSYRTVLTSDGSSPACSPVRESFSSHPGDPSFSPETVPQEAQPRPNAQAILERRKSMQTANTMVDARVALNLPVVDSVPRSLVNESLNVASPSSNRFSLGPSPLPVMEETPLTSPPATTAAGPTRQYSRRGPPPTLGFSRPLSVVRDQPSPLPLSPSAVSQTTWSRGRFDTPSNPVSRAPTSPLTLLSETWGLNARPAPLPPTTANRRASLQVVMPQSPSRKPDISSPSLAVSPEFKQERRRSMMPHLTSGETNGEVDYSRRARLSAALSNEPRSPHSTQQGSSPPRTERRSGRPVVMRPPTEIFAQSMSPSSKHLDCHPPVSPMPSLDEPLAGRRAGRSVVMLPPPADAPVHATSPRATGHIDHVAAMPLLAMDAPLESRRDRRPKIMMPPSESVVSKPYSPVSSMMLSPISSIMLSPPPTPDALAARALPTSPGRPLQPQPSLRTKNARNAVSTQHLAVNPESNVVSKRVSVSHLVDGPPPAPPPTCALPPIPAPPPTCALPPVPARAARSNSVRI